MWFTVYARDFFSAGTSISQVRGKSAFVLARVTLGVRGKEGARVCTEHGWTWLDAPRRAFARSACVYGERSPRTLSHTRCEFPKCRGRVEESR
eukprot:6192564-Pleurochrysis_carterae.AAC.1